MSYDSSAGDDDSVHNQTRKLRPDEPESESTSRAISASVSMATDRQLVHPVAVPPSSGLWEQFKDVIKDIFFADDPLRPYKEYQGRRRWLAYVYYLVPILDWLPKYNLKFLKGDLVGGLTITSLSVPQDLAYARLANLPPIQGLYTSFVPPLIYAMLGSSKHMVIGPVAVVSTLLGSMLRSEIDPETDAENYLRLALTATFFAGLVQLGLGILRMGFLVDFLSHAAIVGFMSGAAVSIALQQLRGLLGLRKFTTHTDIVSVLTSVFENTDTWNWQTIVLGVIFLTFLITVKRLSQVRRHFFWLAAIAPLLSVTLGTLIVFIARLDNDGVRVIGKIHTGVNPSSFNNIFWSGDYVITGFKIGVVTGLVGLTEAFAIGRTFAAFSGYRIDGNKEMLALGTSNILGSWTSCYVATGSFSRSAVNYQSGCKTAMSNIIMSIAVLFVLLVLIPLFHHTPVCVLSAIIIQAVLGLIDLRAVYLVWKTDKVDFVVLAGAFLGVCFVSVEIGLLIAVSISLAKILLNVIRPHIALLGNIPGTNVYRNVKQYPMATSEPGMVIVRVDASIYFSNANYVLEKILRYVNDGEDDANDDDGIPIQFLIIEMAPVMTIDTAGVHVFEELNAVLQNKGIQMTIANPVGGVISTLRNAGFLDLLGQEWFFISVSEGVQVCTMMMKRSKSHTATGNLKQNFSDDV
ncbi:hypothetical protein R1sor_025580 [Riccia sorocarpa]|uniref:STAS domain-containing protein n=1 Tax=Riccia sorocarpa TaxID=122646 RepID=A0ABD3G913_9MARC